MTGLLLLRLRAHRLLLTAALLAVLLTTSVLAALAAFSGSVGDAALRGTLGGRAAASASLVIEADVPRERREAAQRAVVRGAREAFGGLYRSAPSCCPKPSTSSTGSASRTARETLLLVIDRATGSPNGVAVDDSSRHGTVTQVPSRWSRSQTSRMS